MAVEKILLLALASGDIDHEHYIFIETIDDVRVTNVITGLKINMSKCRYTETHIDIANAILMLVALLVVSS